MEDYFQNFMDFGKKPATVETFVDILLCSVPIWLAVLIGLVIGWSWRPRWTGLVYLGLRHRLRFVWTFPLGFGTRRLWLAFTAVSAFSVAVRFWLNFILGKLNIPAGSPAPPSADSTPAAMGSAESVERTSGNIGLSTGTSNKQYDLVTEKDLDHMVHILDKQGRYAAWQNLMERSASDMEYQAWRHDPQMGPSIYRTRTVFEDATPELVRDFFWDDEFRATWDCMLAYFKMMDECTDTGMTIVHWIRKFPFFCSAREYVIGRRIWEDGNTYYCVTKGVPYPDLQRCDKPRRVDTYFSSWVIKPVESRSGDGQLTACEVTLVHYEDTGIPKDVAKLGIRHGMWGTVKKLHDGFRAYQLARNSGAPQSRSALSAGTTTKISLEEIANSSPETVNGEEESQQGFPLNNLGGVDWKWLVIGGTVAVACGLHTGVIGKALIFGAGHRLMRGRGVAHR